MKIGVFVSKISENSGGAFSFQNEIIKALEKTNCNHEIYIFHYGGKKHKESSCIKYIRLDEYKNNVLYKVIKKIIKKDVFNKSLFNKALKKYCIDLVWFVAPAFEKVEIPYISTVWDLQHRLQPFFPEVSVSGWVWEDREKVYSSILPRAAYVITGTEEGKKEVMRFYGIDSERIISIPFPSPSYDDVKILDNCNLIIEKNYLFYPAQFWPHKNHIALLYALNILKKQIFFRYKTCFNRI